MKKGEKKGQVTIFIILAIIIVGLVAVIYMFYPQIRSTFITEAKNPQAFMDSCLEEDLEELVDIISSHGGYYEPEFSYLYKDTEIAYLCYTNEYYVTCIVQEPMLKQTIEIEIREQIEPKVSTCLDEMQKDFRARGYQVSVQKGSTEVELLPKRVIVTSNSAVTLSKEATDVYDKISVSLNNNVYELISIANSILTFETTLGRAEPTLYMDNYRDLKVERLKQSDGTAIYILTDLNNQKIFQFASRSVAWPPGYSNEE